MSAAVSGWGCTALFAEDLGEIALRGEAGCGSDAFDREVGFEQQPLGTIQSDAFDLLAEGASRGCPEANFEGAAGDQDVIDHVGNRNAVTGMIMDESECRADVGILMREDVAGTAGDDPEGPDHEAAGGGDAAFHHAVQQLGGLKPTRFGIESHA